MRSGTCAVQQTLATEAASILKHSLTLARRRGHAQVTPLHVAATLLSLRNSVLKRACFNSQQTSSSPLHCRALELCFNVALNRLPTTPSLLHSHPSLSNALVAALKRAQAHQKRGCIEQPPLLAVKVELDQLLISILDDPSVSRVMREAGFSSTAVKTKLEDSSACHVEAPVSATANFWPSHFLPFSTNSEDIKLVIDAFLVKNKNAVIVSDSTSAIERLVGEMMRKAERGELPLEMKHVEFVPFQMAPLALKFMRKEDVEMNIAELRRRVETKRETGAVIYTGDIGWTAEGDGDGRYCAASHLVKELATMLSEEVRSRSRVRLLATCSYQTFMRCQMTQPPLDSLWSLHTVCVPSSGLVLSLQASSQNVSRNAVINGETEKSMFAKTGLPPWLHLDKDVMNKNLIHPMISFASVGVPRFRRQQQVEPTLYSLRTKREGKDEKISLSLGGNLVSESWREKGTGTFCRLLEENIPWQSDAVSAIADALSDSKSDSWLVVAGNDVVGKRRLALVLRETFPGSFVHLNGSINDLQKLETAMNGTESCVVFIEEVDRADAKLVKALSERYESEKSGEAMQGEPTNPNSKGVFILTTGSEDETRKPRVVQMTLHFSKETNKRKASYALACKSKSAKGSSFDLNVEAEEEDEGLHGERSPVSSDLTRETCSDLAPCSFIESIKKRHIFNRNEGQNREMEGILWRKMKKGVEEVVEEGDLGGFSVEEKVLEGLVEGMGSFLNSVFEKWVREVFQKGVKKGKLTGEVGIRLCFGGLSDTVTEDGYEGTYLPNKFEVTDF